MKKLIILLFILTIVYAIPAFATNKSKTLHVWTYDRVKDETIAEMTSKPVNPLFTVVTGLGISQFDALLKSSKDVTVAEETTMPVESDTLFTAPLGKMSAPKVALYGQLTNLMIGERFGGKLEELGDTEGFNFYYEYQNIRSITKNEKGNILINQSLVKSISQISANIVYVIQIGGTTPTRNRYLAFAIGVK